MNDAVEDEAIGKTLAPAISEHEHVLVVDAGLEEIAQLEAELEALRRAADEAVRRVAARWEQVSAPLRARLERRRFEVLAAVPHIGYPKNRQSRTIANGTVGWRTRPERLVLDDADAAVAWAKLQPVAEGLIRIKHSEEPEMRALAAHWKETGEVPAGCRVVPEAKEWYATAFPTELQPAIPATPPEATRAIEERSIPWPR